MVTMEFREDRGTLKERLEELSQCHLYNKITADLHEQDHWVQLKIAESTTLRQNIRNYLNPKEVPEKYLVQLKDLLSEAKPRKSAVSDVIRQGKDYLCRDNDPLLDFDLAAVEGHWLELRRLLKELAREARALNGFRSDVCLYYTATHDSPISSPIKNRIPLGNERVINLKADPAKSLLKEKGRKWFAKLSIPYRVFIKSKVKLHYKGGGSSRDTSFTDSDLSTITECSSLDTSFNSPRIKENTSIAKIIREVRNRLPKEDTDSEVEEQAVAVNNGSVSTRVLSSNELAVHKSVTNLSQAQEEQEETSTQNMETKVEHSSPRTSPKSPRPGTRSSPCHIEEDSPISSKRRRLNSDDSCSSTNPSPRDSPTPLESTDLSLPIFNQTSPLSVSPTRGEIKHPKPELPRKDATPFDSPLALSALNPDDLRNHGNASFDGMNSSISSCMSSAVSTPTDSPYPTLDFRKRYKKDELWAAIQSDYQYLMGEDIIETCKSTESDLSWESDEAGGCGGVGNTQVSFNEFLQQYKELTEWLGQLQGAAQRSNSSLSEKYLNQRYHEEMLQRSPRRRLFNEYAKQLQRRYPSMRDEIQARLQRVNGQWEKLQKAICPTQGPMDEASMIRDLEQDLNCLQTWILEVEEKLTSQSLQPGWTPEVIQNKIREHKILQTEIESHSKIVSAILKLCERLESDDDNFSPESEKESLQLLAINLERRWHAIWLQSLEWQCRLEEAHTRDKGLYRVQLADDLDFDLEESKQEGKTATPIATQTDFSSPVPTKRQSDFGTDPIHLSGDCETTDTEARSGRHRIQDGNESDTSNYDVIPFSEGEYEKIPIDTDGFTDVDDPSKLGGKSSPDSGSAGHYVGSGCETDHGIDSALGRSCSDHSVEADNKGSGSVYHSAIKLSGDKVNPPAVVVSKHVMDMKASSRDMIQSKHQSKKREHDIGYSSESHSNEDLDLHKDQPKVKFGSSSTGTEHEPHATSSPRLGAKSKSHWRHSMTSAYDTCSNGSDPNLLENDNNRTADPKTDEPQDSGFTSANYASNSDEYSMSRSASSNQNFYFMTTLEADSDPSSSVDPLSSQSNPYDRCESGNTSDIDDSELSRSIDFQFDEENGYTPFSTIPEEGDAEYKPSRKCLFGADTGHGDGERTLDDSGPNAGESDRGSYTSATANLLRFIESRCPGDRGDSLSVQLDSEASSRAAAFSEDELAAAAEQLLDDDPVVPKETYVRLAKQAELLVGEEKLNKLTSHRWPAYEELPDAAKKIKANDSFTSTDGSVIPRGRRTSSCDASDESGSEQSFTSGDRTAQDSILSLRKQDESDTTDVTGSQRCAQDIYGPVKLRHKSDKETKDGNIRPKSVTEMYAMSSGLDLSPFSISESAIDSQDKALIQELNQKLRRTTSEQSPLPVKRLDSPRKHRRRKLKTSVSEGSRTPTKRASPQGSRHKLQSTPAMRGKARRSTSPTLSPVVLQGLQDARRRTQIQDTDSEMEHRACLVSDTTDDRQTTTAAPSTVEFSENAWDHYQMPPQQCLSDDPGEEKLDASHLQGEWDIHSHDDDCSLHASYDSLRGAALRVKESTEKKSLKSKVRGRLLEDSDSDLEDFQNVIAESLKALSFTENVLTKHRKDPMETGLSLDPSEYNESLATCRTNAKCLNVVVETLQSEMGMTNVTDDDIDHVIDMIDRWRSLESLAHERLVQAQQLGALYKDMLALQGALDETDAVLGRQDFTDVSSMEAAIFAVQQRRDSLSGQRLRLEAIGKGVQAFENNHEDVNMNKFMKEVDNLESYLDDLTARTHGRLSELQSALLSWYDVMEKSRELEHCLDREQKQVRCLDLSHDLMALTSQEINEARTDLKKLEDEFKPLSGKLQMVRALHADVAAYLERQAELEMRASVGSLHGQLTELKQKHEAMALKLEQRVRQVEVGAAVAMETSTPTPTRRQNAGARADERSLAMRLLRAALPIKLLFLLVLAIAYVLDPQLLDNLGLVVSPELKYVRGPPPM